MAHMCNISFIFRICKLLKVLDLEKIDIGNTFPSEVELLGELRYLAIYGDIESIPLSVANLSKLETFRVRTYGLEALLPATIWNMTKLRHLVGLGKFVDISLLEDNLDSFPSLYNLDTFSTLTLSVGPTTEKITGKFPNVRKLKCRLFASGGSIGKSNGIVALDLLSRLESLKLILGHYQIEFQFPLNLKKLTLEYFPSSIISSVGKLPNLEVLKLHTPVFEGVIWDMEEEDFPELKVLKLVQLNMVMWTGSGDHLPQLRKLVLQQCWKLEEIPSCLGYIQNLEIIEVRWCSPFTASLVRKIEEEQRSGGNEDLKTLILGEHKTSS